MSFVERKRDVLNRRHDSKVVVPEGEEKKGIQWMLSSLWLAIGSRGVHHKAIYMNVPDTVLFLGGHPSKWLSTDENGEELIHLQYHVDI